MVAFRLFALRFHSKNRAKELVIAEEIQYEIHDRPITGLPGNLHRPLFFVDGLSAPLTREGTKGSRVTVAHPYKP